MKNIYLDLFLTFMKIGAFTFGGGYAMIAMIETICVDQKKWFTHDEMLNMTVIAESTPGPIAINSSTYVGYRQAGVPGAVAATLGMVLPSFVIIFLISMFFDRFLEYPVVAHAFQGIKIGVGVLICSAGVSMLRKMPKNLFSRLIAAGTMVVILAVNFLSLSVSTITLMVFAAGIGITVSTLRRYGSRKKEAGE